MCASLAARRTTLVVLVTLLALTAAPASAESVKFLGLAFPETIGGAQRGVPHDFESEAPGLGYSVKYRAAGWFIDVYVYDLRRQAIPSEATSEPVKAQLVQATDDVQHRPTATDIKITRRYELSDQNARVRFLCTSFNYKDRDTPVDSYLCVTSWQNKFVKFRLSRRSQAGSDIWANHFVRSWMPVLWPS